jgi:hypothetical protein
MHPKRLEGKEIGLSRSTLCRWICTVLAVAAFGCDRPPQPTLEHEDPPVVQEGAPDAGNRFAPDTVAVGDSIGSFVVHEVEASRVEHPDFPEGAWVGRASFGGVEEVVGSYGPHPDYPEVERICFEVDRGFAGRLPVFETDTRRPWFCFSNHADARTLLGDLPTTGRASVRITDFRYRFEFSDVYNEAAVIERLQ